MATKIYWKLVGVDIIQGLLPTTVNEMEEKTHAEVKLLAVVLGLRIEACSVLVDAGCELYDVRIPDRQAEGREHVVVRHPHQGDSVGEHMLTSMCFLGA
jgi:hypothetical protein